MIALYRRRLIDYRRGMERPFIRINVGVVVAVVLLVSTISCRRTSKNPIAGTWWEITGQNELAWENGQSPYTVLEFFPREVFEMSGPTSQMSGKYSFPGRDYVKFEIGGPGGISLLHKYSLSGDKLVLTVDGKNFTYWRTKIPVQPNCDLPACELRRLGGVKEPSNRLQKIIRVLHDWLPAA